MTCEHCEAVARSASHALLVASDLLLKAVNDEPITEGEYQRLYILTARVGELASSMLESDTVGG